MKQVIFKFIAVGTVLFSMSQASAHEITSDQHVEPKTNLQLVEAEVATDLKHGKDKSKLQGPKKTEGIEKVYQLGAVPLKGEFTDINNRKIRGRVIDIKPGGVVAVHSHHERPGIAYIISGELTEHREGAGGPAVKKAGDAALENSKTVHWWRNDGNTTAKIIVVDIVPLDVK